MNLTYQNHRNCQEVKGPKMPPVLVGDAAFGLGSNIMRPLAVSGMGFPSKTLFPAVLATLTGNKKQTAEDQPSATGHTSLTIY
ncbi:hypothetical protein PR048_020332 [Dryococelus australis]|uniref:DDE Tnp4 domain-containing protein n=1 Tax=Dryococelus australis TaxID=614101 RepID=A0ABQ9H602_9NEOP|nr:hypothetical protein PR048_020332 [Dryococelus australis]